MAGRSAGYVFGQVRALLGDPAGDWATDDYLVPFLQQAQDDLEAECLRDSNIGPMKSWVVLPNVAEGVTSLKPYFADDQPLALLEVPIELREKTAGAPDEQYSFMRPLLTPAVVPGLGNYNLYYTWTGDDIQLPGASQDLDIWIYGQFRPTTITSPETALVPMTEQLLTQHTGELVAFSRGNSKSERGFAARYGLAKDVYMREVYKINQSIRVRNLPFRRRGTYWNDPQY